jgi:WD repeat-containing protein 19
VDYLKDITVAVNIVRKTRSRDSAKMIVKHFQEKSEYKAVVEFCILAGMDREALEIAMVRFQRPL